MLTLATGSVLAEVTAQIMGPFLLGKITDFNGLIDDAKMVIVNNLIQVFQNSQKSDGALLKYAAKTKLKVQNTPANTLNLLEKNFDKIDGYSQLGDSGSGYWMTLKPK